MDRPALFGSTLVALQQYLAAAGEPAFRAKQLTEWLYAKNCDSVAAMTNLSKTLRTRLEADFVFGTAPAVFEDASADGTKKYLFRTAAGLAVESAWLPEETRGTLCLSTQSGCRMGCRFCGTARMGWRGNLTAGEIVNQYRSLPERENVTNIVYMGMGEPLDNLDAVLGSLAVMTEPWGYAWSPTRITVSTIGLVDRLPRFLEGTKAHLAVSLHSPFEEERNRLMPLTAANPLAELLAVLRAADWHGQRRLTFEYIVFGGLNDTKKHAEALSRLVRGLECRINLIAFHEVPGSGFPGSGPGALERFQALLEPSGARVTIRRSRGLDIRAACGLLATEEGAR